MLLKKKRKEEPQVKAAQPTPEARPLPVAVGQTNLVPFYDGMLCPLSHVLLTDPVLTCDGNSFDRHAIEEWLRRGSVNSPLTGLPLDNLNLIPNHNLRRATTHLALSNPALLHQVRLSPSITSGPLFAPPCQSQTLVSHYSVFRHFVSDHSKLSLGDDIDVLENTIASYKENKTTQNLQECTVFIENSLRSCASDLPSFGIEIVTTQTHTSLFQIGLTTKDPDKWINTRNIQDFIECNAYYFDISGSLYRPGEFVELSHWPRSRYLSSGDRVFIGISEDGNLWITQNGTVVVDYPMKAPLKKYSKPTDFQQYWGFVSLFGTILAVRVIPNFSCCPLGPT